MQIFAVIGGLAVVAGSVWGAYSFGEGNRLGVVAGISAALSGLIFIAIHMVLLLLNEIRDELRKFNKEAAMQRSKP